MTFADQLRAELRARKLTQKDAAEILGVSHECISKWCRGIVTPSQIKQEGALARLAKIKRPAAKTSSH